MSGTYDDRAPGIGSFSTWRRNNLNNVYTWTCRNMHLQKRLPYLQTYAIWNWLAQTFLSDTRVRACARMCVLEHIQNSVFVFDICIPCFPQRIPKPHHSFIGWPLSRLDSIISSTYIWDSYHSRRWMYTRPHGSGLSLPPPHPAPLYLSVCLSTTLHWVYLY